MDMETGLYSFSNHNIQVTAQQTNFSYENASRNDAIYAQTQHHIYQTTL